MGAVMLRIDQLSTRVKVVLLLSVGLVVGVWISHGLATGSRPASEARLVFEVITLLTFIWMLIWTLRRRVKEDHDG